MIQQAKLQHDDQLLCFVIFATDTCAQRFPRRRASSGTPHRSPVACRDNLTKYLLDVSAGHPHENRRKQQILIGPMHQFICRIIFFNRTSSVTRQSCDSFILSNSTYSILVRAMPWSRPSKHLVTLLWFPLTFLALRVNPFLILLLSLNFLSNTFYGQSRWTTTPGVLGRTIVTVPVNFDHIWSPCFLLSLRCGAETVWVRQR